MPGVITSQSLDPGGQLLPSSVVEVLLERRIRGTTNELGWEAITSRAPIVVTLTPGLLWHGHVNLPASAAAASLRLVIREFDHRVADAITGHAQPAGWSSLTQLNGAIERQLWCDGHSKYASSNWAAELARRSAGHCREWC